MTAAVSIAYTGNLLARAAQLTALVAAGRIPALYLKKGRSLQLATPEQCAVVAELYVGDRGCDSVDDIPLHDAAGRRIGFISYNGRTWLGQDSTACVEIPQRGRKTCAERNAAGWSNS